MFNRFLVLKKFIRNILETGSNVTLWVDLNGIQICFQKGFSLEEEPLKEKIILTDDDGTCIPIDCNSEVRVEGVDFDLICFEVHDKEYGTINITLSTPLDIGIQNLQSLVPEEIKSHFNKLLTLA